MRRDESVIRLLIEDDGQGMTKPAGFTGRSFGLAGMRERISMLGGTVKVSSVKGSGTKIEVTVPVPEVAQQARPANVMSAVAGEGHQESA